VKDVRRQGGIRATLGQGLQDMLGVASPAVLDQGGWLRHRPRETSIWLLPQTNTARLPRDSATPVWPQTYVTEMFIHTCGYEKLKRIVGERGQVVIPKQIRERLGLKPRETVIFELKQNSILLHTEQDPVRFSEELVSAPRKLKTISMRRTKKTLEEQYEI